MNQRLDVAVIGGGIAGLAALDRLRTRVPALACRLFEAGERVGGKVRTDRIEHEGKRFIIESGPDGWLSRKPWASDLARDLGLGDQIRPIANLPAGVAIVRNGLVISIPVGTSLIASPDPESLQEAGLLSADGCQRMLAERDIPPRDDPADESLAAFVRRRLGDEVVSALAEPLAAGIHNANPECLSLLATFPQFRALEREHGSVVRGLRVAHYRDGYSSQPAFETLRDGTGALIDALFVRNQEAIQTRANAEVIDQDAGSGWIVRMADGSTVHARAVVLAAPATTAADMLARVTPDLAAAMRTFRTVPAGSIGLAFPGHAIAQPLPGYGLVIPQSERRPINAITITSRKWPDCAPEGWHLVRVFFGGFRSPKTMELADDELLTVVMSELRSLLGLTGEPALHRITRFAEGSPQYDVGHLDRIAALSAALPEFIAVTGCAWRGTGLPDLIHDGRQVADRMAMFAEQSLEEARTR